MGGNTRVYNGASISHMVRLNSDGSVDNNFDVGIGFNSSISSIGLANDSSGDVFAVGEFTSYDTTIVEHIVRINPDGSIN